MGMTLILIYSEAYPKEGGVIKMQKVKQKENERERAREREINCVFF